MCNLPRFARPRGQNGIVLVKATKKLLIMLKYYFVVLLFYSCTWIIVHCPFVAVGTTYPTLRGTWIKVFTVQTISVTNFSFRIRFYFFVDQLCLSVFLLYLNIILNKTNKLPTYKQGTPFYPLSTFWGECPFF